MSGVLAHPTVQRWLPVVVLPPILLLDGVLAADGKPVDGLSAVFAVLASLPLALRSRLGFLGMAPLVVGGVVLVLWNFEPHTTVVAIPAWALFDLARYYGRREVVAAAILVAPCVLASVLPFADTGEEVVSVTLRNLALCELALAGGYLVWHTRRAVERELAAREADAERRLGDERLRVAREVHDVVAHAMVAINVQAGVAAHLLGRDTGQAREALAHIKRTSGEALNDLRATLRILRDPERAVPTGPATGLHDLDAVAAQLRAAGVDVEVNVEVDGAVPTPVHAAGYRIVQEALTNVLRHACAGSVRVVARTAGDGEVLSIVVIDDGRGHGSGTQGAGTGVRGMRERAEAFGGTLSAGPDGQNGWRVEARLPLAPARARA